MPVTVDIGWPHTNIHYARALIVVCPMELDVLYASQETNTESAPTSHDIVTLEGSRVMMRNVEGQQSVQKSGKERLLYATY